MRLICFTLVCSNIWGNVRILRPVGYLSTTVRLDEVLVLDSRSFCCTVDHGMGYCAVFFSLKLVVIVSSDASDSRGCARWLRGQARDHFPLTHRANSSGQDVWHRLCCEDCPRGERGKLRRVSRAFGGVSCVAQIVLTGVLSTF